DQNGEQARGENGPGGNVETAVPPRLRFRVQAVEERLDRAVKEFGSEYAPNTEQDQAPLDEAAVESDARGDGDGRGEQVDREAGMPLDAQFEAANRPGELLPPAAYPFRSRSQRRWSNRG